jgi:hypothetical protein
MSGRFVVKIQLPLMTNAPKPMALVYDEQRRIQQEFPITKALRRSMARAVKAYFWAHMQGKELHLDERTGDQPW